jgi:hypothetical protein
MEKDFVKFLAHPYLFLARDQGKFPPRLYKAGVEGKLDHGP